jgi:hypothetical protein
MIEIHTSDVGEALPSAILGPFVIADADDVGSYLKLDPASAEIVAAGAARPTRWRSIGALRATGSTGEATIGTGMAAWSVGADDVGGFFTKAFRIPDEMDLAAPLRVYLVLRPATGSLGSVKVVRTELTVTYGKDGDTTVSDQTVTHDWSTPASWQTQPKLVLVDAGSGVTFAGGTFERDDVLGLRARLVRDAIEDNFDQAVHMGAGVLLSYTAERY